MKNEKRIKKEIGREGHTGKTGPGLDWTFEKNLTLDPEKNRALDPDKNGTLDPEKNRTLDL